MANVLISALANPASMKSGGTTTVTVRYAADNPGDMSIAPSAQYQTAPPSSAIVAVGPNESVDVPVQVAGPNGDCVLTFTFFGSPTYTVVRIEEGI